MRGNPRRRVALRRLVPVIPGLFTFGNLMCGFLALLHTMGDKPINAAWFIFLGAFFDLLDGKVARLTRTSSHLGIQLDSLADFLTFGVAPVAMMRAIGLFDIRDWKLAAGILYLFASAFRLARFNVSAKLEGADYYIGLPIPVAAVTVASGLLFTKEVWPPIYGTGIFGGIAVLAWLMVSNVRYDKYFPKTIENKISKTFIIALFLLLILSFILYTKYIIYPLCIIYIIIGLVREAMRFLGKKPKKHKKVFDEEI